MIKICFCKKEFKVKPYRKDKAKFCSYKCHNQWMSENLSGQNSPFWKGGEVAKKCLICYKKFKVKLYLQNISKFCSLQCQGKWQKESGIHAKENHPNWKGGAISIKCLNCKKGFKIIPSRTKNGKGKLCSRKCFGEWQSQNRVGKNHPMWKGGITPLNDKIRHSFEYKEWAKTIKERDDFTCQICYIRGGNLRSNHIKKFSDCVELRFDLNNGITICENCDLKKVMNHENEWEDYFNKILKGGKQLLQI